MLYDKQHKTSYEDEAMILSKAAQIVPQETLSTTYTDKQTFQEDCQHNFVPESLKFLIVTIFGSPNIQTQSSNFMESHSTLTNAKLLQFDCTIRIINIPDQHFMIRNHGSLFISVYAFIQRHENVPS